MHRARDMTSAGRARRMATPPRAIHPPSLGYGSLEAASGRLLFARAYYVRNSMARNVRFSLTDAALAPAENMHSPRAITRPPLGMAHPEAAFGRLLFYPLFSNL